MPRDSIQITGLVIERSAEGVVTVVVRTPDNASFQVYQSVDDPRPTTSFVGAQALLSLKRDAQKVVADDRVVLGRKPTK